MIADQWFIGCFDRELKKKQAIQKKRRIGDTAGIRDLEAWQGRVYNKYSSYYEPYENDADY